MRKLWQRDRSRLTKTTLAESAADALAFTMSAWVALLRADAREALDNDDYRDAFVALMEAHRLLTLLTLSAPESGDGE